MKIVIIGAGSTNFGLGQIVDLLQSRELMGRGVQVTLVDTNEQTLQTMLGVAERIKEHTMSDIALDATTDRTEALPGADYVITAVAQERFPLWEQDFRVPLAYGFRHCLGENGGPGAVFHTMRSLKLIVPICRDIERLCPDALLLNFTNPEARVLHAICHLTKVKAAGICHGVFSALRWVTRHLDRPLDDLHVVSAGMNHFYCLMEVLDKVSGKDHLPELVAAAATDDSVYSPPLFRKMAEVFGVFTYPSDDHIGEYLSYGSDYGGIKWHYGQESRAVVCKEEVAFASKMAEYASGARPIDQELLGPYNEITVPIIVDIELDRGSYRHAVNVVNTGAYIPNLPKEAVVEVPAMVDGQGIHPLSVAPLPETFAAMMRPHFTIHGLLTEAFRTGSKNLLLQALLLDPNVNSITSASRMLDDMLKLQEDYLPSFS